MYLQLILNGRKLRDEFGWLVGLSYGCIVLGKLQVRRAHRNVYYQVLIDTILEERAYTYRIPLEAEIAHPCFASVVYLTKIKKEKTRSKYNS